MRGEVSVGDVVYQPYTPQRVGKIVEDLGPRDHTLPFRHTNDPITFHDVPMVRVRWLKKGRPETDEPRRDLRRVSDLIEEHRAKIRGHECRLEAASKL